MACRTKPCRRDFRHDILPAFRLGGNNRCKWQVGEVYFSRRAAGAGCFAKKADAAISLLDSRKAIESTLRKYLVTDTADDYPELTMREREIVVGIAKGLSNKEIAEVLHVSVNTVMTHRRNIASKLEIHSPAGLTIYAIVTKLVDITEVQMS